MKNSDIDIIRDYLYFGVDELEFTIGDIKKNVLFNKKLSWEINDSNSSEGNIIINGIKFNYVKIKPKGYSEGLRFQAVFLGEIVGCFAILKGGKNGAITSNNKIVFYSSFFVLENLGILPFSLLEFYVNNFDTLESKLYRLDICLDLPYEIPEIKDGIFKNIFFDGQIGKDKKHPEFNQTYYIKEIKSRNNRKFIFRIYDKVLDTWKKKKGFLYPHLENNSNVRRIELELRAEECQRVLDFSIMDYLSDGKDSIKKTFAEYFNRFTLYKIDYSKLELTKYKNNRFDLKKRFLEIGHIPEDYLATAHGWNRNILENCGYSGLFQVILGSKLEDIHIKKYIRNAVENILNGQKNLTSIDTFKNDRIFGAYELLDNLLIYMHDSNLSEAIINNILKRHHKTPRIKLKIKN